MTIAYPHCAERLFGRAHAIEPAALRSIIEGPAARRILSGERPEGKVRGKNDLAAIRRKRMSMVEADPVAVANGCGEYALTPDGVAIVQVMGVLSQRFDWLAALCGWTTYEGLAATFDAMLGDTRVKAVLMDVESPGGEAAGMPDIVDVILAAREKKPIWAVANTFAASAAYGIAGASNVLYVPRLALVGSIGAVAVHVDQSAADEAYGERYTAVYSGARKIDGWSHAALSEGAQSAMQRGVDYCRDQFAELVGRQGRMTAAEAIATEAAMYHDAEAISAKLADRVGSFDDALAALSASANGRPSTKGVSLMKTGSNAAEAPKADVEIVAAAAETPVAPVAEAAESDEDEPGKPGPGEVCATCGQTMPAGEGTDDKSDGDEKPMASAQTPDVRSDVTAILDLCASQGIGIEQASQFVKNKATLADVREKIAAEKAAAADALKTSATADKPIENAGWDDVAAKVNKEFGVKPK
jgi:ClpP class serine protease